MPSHPEHPTFAALLKQFRSAAGLSINAAASRAGIDAAYLWRLEKGSPSRPSPIVVDGLIAALRLTALEAEELRVSLGYCPDFIARLHPARFRALYEFLEKS